MNFLPAALKKRSVKLCFIVGVAWVVVSGLWLQFGHWPDPTQEPLLWSPDIIVILGGGDVERIIQGKMLADQYPVAPLLVTGDGGLIVESLKHRGVSAKRIIHEKYAESTMENALFSKTILVRLHSTRVAIVTDWFHVPRSLAAFRHELPQVEFAASFGKRGETIKVWERDAQRRERFASLFYLFRFGVWSW